MNKKFKKFSNPVIMPTQQEMQMLKTIMATAFA